MLPLEDDVRRQIESECRGELADCRDLMRLALRLLCSEADGSLNVPVTPAPGIGDWARSIALGLYVKACKQFRGILLLGEQGLGGEVTVLTRCLFETALTLNLLLQEQVALKKDGADFNPDPSRPLTTDLRALL
jgi:hypothetical protein